MSIKNWMKGSTSKLDTNNTTAGTIYFLEVKDDVKCKSPFCFFDDLSAGEHDEPLDRE